MNGRSRRALLSAVLLLGGAGCGAPVGAKDGPGGPRVGLQALGTDPDFVVTKVSAPASAMPGSPFESTVEVCNRGGMGGGVDVGLYFSDDAEITPWDFWAQTFFVGYLAPGQCQSQSVLATASVPTNGAWHVGAYADPYGSQFESDEKNNGLAGPVMGIGYGPDFVIASVKGPSSTDVGQPFTAQVTVCNQGTQPGSTDVEVYLSADETITPNVPPGVSEDSFVGSGFTDWLMPGQCGTLSVNGGTSPPAPGTEGPYYLGAVADPHGAQPELIENNNALAGYRMGVGHRPDFVITSVKGPSSADFGQPLTAQVTVCNRGTQAGSTGLDVYLSADETLNPAVPPNPPEDSLVGGIFTDWLVPGQCSTVSVSGVANPPAPGLEGPYYLGAVADQYNNQPELIEDNNSLAGYRMGLGHRPDLVVASVKGPASAQNGQPITTQVTVCNRGTQPSYGDVEVYLSADAAIHANGPSGPSEDAFLGMAPVDSVLPGQCTTVPVSGVANVPPPGNPGPYFVGAVVDPYNNQPELIEDNNSLAGYRMGVGYRADFVVTAVKGPDSAQSGQSITAQVTVCNQGTQPDSTDVEVYLSADDSIRANVPPYYSGDAVVGSAPVGYLFPGQCVTVPVTGYANVPPPGTQGPYYVGAVVDPYGNQPELIDDNNSLAGYRMGVGHRPDFVITSVKGPSSATPGQPVTAQVTVCNRGNESGSTDLEVYLSADDVIRANAGPYPFEDSLLGSALTDFLSPGQCRTVPVSGSANVPPPGYPGPYFVGAVVDPHGYMEELIDDNNTLVGYRMGVGNGPDFVVTAVKGPSSATPGQPITTQVTVCNRGTQPDSTDVDVYLSTDEVIRAYVFPNPPEDSYVGTASTGYLAPDQCATVPVSGSANVPPPGNPGPYFVGAVADPYGGRPELIEDNNSLAGYRMGVGNRADFVITSVAGPYSAQSGQAISTQVTVCNQGTQADSTEVQVFLSADEVIRANVASGPPEDSFVGSASTTIIYPGQCATVSVSGNANVPPPGDSGAYYVGAVADPYGNRPELIEDNNSLAGYRMGVGNRADFVITSLTGPYSVTPGAAFTVSVGVCNRGQLSDTMDVDLYLSADTNVRVPTPPGPPEDFYLGTVTGVSLAAGACTTRTQSVTAPYPPEGAYYLGGVVDPYNARPELIEDNNTKVGSIIGVGTKADFTLTGVTGPASVRPGAAFTANVSVCNRGQAADTMDVDLYLSADTNVRVPTLPGPPEDFYLGKVTSVSLAAGACTTRAVSVTAPSVPDGAYYLGGVADPYNARPELVEDNNAKAGNVIGVGLKADFVVTAATGPSSIKLGAAFTASVTVCNRGQAADTVDVDLYFSADSTIRASTPPGPPEDFYLGTLSGVSLGVGACSTRSLVVNANAPATGSYYLGAVADPYNLRSELIEDNNTKAGTYMSVIP